MAACNATHRKPQVALYQSCRLILSEDLHLLSEKVAKRWVELVIWTVMLAAPRAACSQEAAAQVAHQTAAELFPASTIFYAEIPQPQKLIALVKEHPLRAKLEAMPEYKQVLKDPNYHKFQLGVAVFEAKMAVPWDEALTAIAEGGIYACFDAETQGAAVLVKAHDLDTLIKLRKTVFELIQGAVAANGQPDPIKKGEYRGLTAYAIDKAKIAALGSWLLITNKDELGKRIIDQYLDGGKHKLSSSENFQRAIASRTDSLSAWSFTDVAAIRASGTAEALYSGKTDNPLAEILFGGLLANLQHTPYATTTVTVEAQQLKLSLASPHKAEWIRESREHYFGADNSGQAPPLIELQEGILSVSSFRDLSQMWLRAGDLMTEKANDDLAKADSQLSTFFSGKSFGEDILGSLDPKLQLVVSRQAAEDLKPVPAVKLPAFALVGRMRQPEMTQPEFRRVFQSFVGFINVIGAMNGQPQLDLDMSNENGRQLIAATYVPQPGDLAAQGARINFNFSPSIAFAGSRFIVASTKQLAQSLMKMDDVNKEAAASTDVTIVNRNTVAALDAAWLKQILEDNRQQLVAQNMLEKGHSKEAAEQEIQILLTLVSLVDQVQLELLTSGDTLQLNTALQLRD